MFTELMHLNCLWLNKPLNASYLQPIINVYDTQLSLKNLSTRQRRSSICSWDTLVLTLSINWPTTLMDSSRPKELLLPRSNAKNARKTKPIKSSLADLAMNLVHHALLKLWLLILLNWINLAIMIIDMSSIDLIYIQSLTLYIRFPEETNRHC